jgi:hypothetical protein
MGMSGGGWRRDLRMGTHRVREHCDGENTDATRWLIHPWKYDRCTDEYTKIMRGLGDSSELDETAAVTTRQRTRMRIIHIGCHDHPSNDRKRPLSTSALRNKLKLD